jgi:taurine dioxygenase
MSYQNFEMHAVSPALGAEVSGLDLSQPLSKAAARELLDAWYDRQVLFFRDQKLTLDQFKVFAKTFGEIEIYKFIRKTQADAKVERLDVETTPPQAPPTTILHVDISSFPIPSKAALLYAVDVPEAGHDTIWASMYAAYEALSKPMQEFLIGKSALYVSMDMTTLDGFIKAGPDGPQKYARFIAQPPVEHPLVHTHPDSGKKALFVDPLRMWSITGLHWEESQALIRFLNSHVSQVQFQARCHWRRGTVAVWDNRCTLHARVDDPVATRTMHRLPIAGTAPPTL